MRQHGTDAASAQPPALLLAEAHGNPAHVGCLARKHRAQLPPRCRQASLLPYGLDRPLDPRGAQQAPLVRRERRPFAGVLGLVLRAGGRQARGRLGGGYDVAGHGPKRRARSSIIGRRSLRCPSDGTRRRPPENGWLPGEWLGIGRDPGVCGRFPSVGLVREAFSGAEDASRGRRPRAREMQRTARRYLGLGSSDAGQGSAASLPPLRHTDRRSRAGTRYRRRSIYGPPTSMKLRTDADRQGTSAPRADFRAWSGWPRGREGQPRRSMRGRDRRCDGRRDRGPGGVLMGWRFVAAGRVALSLAIRARAPTGLARVGR